MQIIERVGSILDIEYHLNDISKIISSNDFLSESKFSYYFKLKKYINDKIVSELKSILGKQKFNKLLKIIKDKNSNEVEVFIESLDEQIKNRLDDYLEEDKLLNLTKTLNPKISFYLEYPYVDKQYRDTYYHHYSKKHYDYKRNCIRISFFQANINIEDFRDFDKKEFLEKEYRGFVVLRPLKSMRLGRSFISPRALTDDNFVSCLASDTIQINGVKLTVEGFPYCPQDNEYVTCAETSIWSVMEYFGTKYNEYSTILPSQIHAISKKTRYERLSPSKGFEAFDTSFILRKFGFGTKIYSRSEYSEELDFQKEFNDYVESGIPIIAVTVKYNSKLKTMLSDVASHSFVVIGHKKIENKQIKNTGKHILVETQKKELKLFDSGLYEGKEYVIMDDNHPPYRMVSFDSPKYGNKKDSVYYQIDQFIVPLHRKVHLESGNARLITKNIFEDKFLQYPDFFDKDLIIRILLTSSRSYKKVISENIVKFQEKESVKEGDYDEVSLYSQLIKWNILSNNLPKFIWIIEVSDEEHLIKGECLGFIILDSTSINSSKGDFLKSIIAIAHPHKFIYKFDKYRKANSKLNNRFNEIETNTKVTYNQYVNNLKHWNHGKG